jgi:hypothetical protein
MTFKELRQEIKEEQKLLAQEIKEQKGKRKQVPNGYVEGLAFDRNSFRHTHIAYCEFFNNTPYKMIEQSCYEAPSRNRIDRLKNGWVGQIDEEEEALRNCA